jgi:hypothetical protein
MTPGTEHDDPAPLLDAGRLAGLLAESDRRSVVAALQLGATTLDDVVVATRLDVRTVASALGTLVNAGLVVQGDAGGLYLVESAFGIAARAALARPSSSEHADRPDEVRRVFDAFVRDGRITEIPASHRKRLVLLDWLAQDFEVGQRYSEARVNAILGLRHPDTAAWRRYLVDEEYLDRADGEYWRSGGTVLQTEP